MDGLRFRFAPSPTGFFHVGGARTALFNWALAKRLGGTFVLRIEDTDEARNRPEWTDGIIDALAWLGINSEDPAFEGPFFQSAFVDEHVAVAHRLFDAGHAYYCDLPADQTQGDAARTRASRDHGLSPGPGRVLRFRVPAGDTVVHDLVRGEVRFDNELIEDFVLLRSNGSPMFLLANVVDDVTMRISHVLRAEEHLPNAPKQQMIWTALGHEPPQWAHVPVLVNEQRKKLSKRRDKVALEQYRNDGILPDAMINYLMTLGWSPGDQEIVPWSFMQDQFRIEDVNHSPAFFDVKKLAAFNGEYIRAMSPEEFIAACQPILNGAEVPWATEHFDPQRFAAMVPFVQVRVTSLTEVPGVVDFLFQPDPPVDEDAWASVMTGVGVEVLRECTTAYAAMGVWGHESLKGVLADIGTGHGMKLGKAQAPVRVAVTGRTVGPPLFESLEVLGRDETLRRMRAALERV